MNTKTDSPSTGDVGIGVDVGTQGARVVAVSEAGRVLASAAERWPLQGDDSGRREQDPDLWWKAIVRSLRSVLTTVEPRRVTCLSVVATSGTMVLLDDQRAPLRPAIMWNDKRAGREAQEATTAFHLSNTDLGLAIQPTFTLAKGTLGAA